MSQEDFSEIDKLIEEIKNKDDLLDRIHKKVGELRDKLDNELRSLKSTKNVKFNEEGLKAFKEHYWTTYKISETEAEIRVPKMYDWNFGWLKDQDKAYNWFRVNPVTNWISEIPPEIKEELGFKKPLDIRVDGNEITGKDIDLAEKQFAGHVKRVGKKLIIKEENFIDILEKMLNNGTMPFGVKPIPKELLSDRPETELYDYQKDAVEKYLQYGRIIVLYPTGFGKTHVAIECMNRVKPRYLILCNKTAIQQWKERIAKFSTIKESEYDIFTYQSGVKHAMKNHYTLGIFDEAHKSVADTFSNLLKGTCDTVIGLTASPFREDGRDSLLIAIFGYPVGARWDVLQQTRWYKPPTVNVWVFKNEQKKMAKFKQLLQTDKKCLVFCDDISFGKRLSVDYDLPFVYGQTKAEDRMTILNQDNHVMVSRVGDESLSIDNIEVGIEIDWFGTSAKQALQRAGRLMHNKEAKDPQHHIVMTVDEYNKDKLRLRAYYEKGMPVEHRKEDGISISELIVKPKQSKQTSLRRVKKIIQQKEPENSVDETTYPLLKYMGVRKIYESLGRSHRKALLFFIDPSNQSKSFTIENYCMAMGYTATPSNLAMTKMNIMKPLIQKKAIIEENGRFRQNFTNMIQA